MPILKLNSIISTPDGRQLQPDSIVSINEQDLTNYYPDTFKAVESDTSDLTVLSYRLEEAEPAAIIEEAEEVENKNPKNKKRN